MKRKVELTYKPQNSQGDFDYELRVTSDGGFTSVTRFTLEEITELGKAIIDLLR